MNKHDRIFIGIRDIGNIQSKFCSAFQLAGLQCDSYLWSTDSNRFYDDITSKRKFLFDTVNPPFLIFGKNIFHIVNKGLQIFHFISLLFKYDVFFFISPYSFDDRHHTLSVIRKLGKKVVFLFTGCVERDTGFDTSDPDYICKNCLDENLQNFCLCGNIEKKNARVSLMEIHCDIIFAQPDISAFVSDKSKLLWFYLPDTYSPADDLISHKYSGDEIIIVHLPSNYKVKQTHDIIPVLKKIASTGGVRVIIKEELWERDRILQTLEEAHILVNSLGTGYNLTAIEAMGRGCVVLNSHPEWYARYVPEAPVIAITKKSLEKTISEIILDREQMKIKACSSVEYYKKFHSAAAVGAFYKQALNLR